MITPFPEPVYVTKPFLPPIEQYLDGLREIWANAWLTNGGPILRRYTEAMVAYLGTENLCMFANGTLALQLGLHGMQLHGEVITTPFTFVATAHALWWNQLKPVFVDIEPQYYTLDPAAVEAAITPETSAILAVHVFGNLCQLEALADIARRHHLRLIYDAAHAFGVTIDGQSIATFGDLTMFSFHATKVYHSIEGGLACFTDPRLKATLNQLKNFGIVSESEIAGPGTNAKMNEFMALMGLQVLPYMEELIAARARLTHAYRERLSTLPGLLLPPPAPGNVTSCYAYLPIEVDETQASISRDTLYERLKTYNVFARRYFYPLLTDCPCYEQDCRSGELPVARRTARQILTLPLYHDLTLDSVHRICDIIAHLLGEPAA